MKTILTVFVVLGVGLAQAQDPWPMERQDRWGTGRAVVGPNINTVTTPWVAKSHTGVGLVTNAPSLTADGLGYVTGWLENKVSELSQATGGVTGTFSVNNWGQCTPAVGKDGEVYAATVLNGQFYCIDRASLNIRWQFVTNNVKINDFDSCSPTIGPDGNVVMGGTSGVAWKFDHRTGALLWKIQGIGTVVKTIVFTRDDKKVIISNGSSVSAYDYATGLPSWTKDLGSTTGAPGVAPNGTIVVGTSSGSVFGLNPTNGNQLWTFATAGACATGPAFSADGVFAYISSYDKKLYAVRVTNGQRPWSLTAVDELRSAPIVDTFGRIYFATRNSMLYCANADGSLRWNAALDYEVRGPMSIGADNTLYVPNGQLRIIKQQALTLESLGLMVDYGSLTLGDQSKLSQSDDQYAVMEAPGVTIPGEPILRATFVTNSPYKKATKFDVVLETQASTPNLTQTVEVFNSVSGTWQLFDTRPAPQVDTTISVNVPALASDFQDVNGGIRARVSYYLLGKPSLSKVQVKIDLARFMNVVPEFKI